MFFPALQLAGTVVMSEVALVNEYFIQAATSLRLDAIHILKSLGLTNEQVKQVSRPHQQCALPGLVASRADGHPRFTDCVSSLRHLSDTSIAILRVKLNNLAIALRAAGVWARQV